MMSKDIAGSHIQEILKKSFLTELNDQAYYIYCSRMAKVEEKHDANLQTVFDSLNKPGLIKGKTIEAPPLTVITEEETRLYAEGPARHEARKQKLASNKGDIL